MSREFVSDLLKKLSPDLLSRLGVDSGVLVNPDKLKPYVQGLYKLLFDNCDIRNTHDLFDWSGISPVFSASAVQSGYKSLFSRGKINDASALFDLSGIKPSDSVIQSGYESLISRRYVDSAHELFDWCKLKPSSELIKKYNINF